MRVVDANVLLAAVNTADPRHEQARTWLDEALSGRQTVGFTWIVLLAFLRLVTRPGLFPSPLSVPDALQVVEDWTRAGPSVVLEPTSRHLSVLSELLQGAGTGGNLVSDAHLASLALEHDATVVTYDRDFGRWPGGRCEAPGA